MKMFAKRLAEKALLKKGAVSSSWSGNGDGVFNSSDVQPRFVFHHGIPSSSGASSIAYESSQGIVAISTSDGRIKLFGNDNTQLLLESPSAAPSKYLQCVQSKGILLNVTQNNHIEVWDLEKVTLSEEFVFEGEITSFGSASQGEYIYLGDSLGNAIVLNLDLSTHRITPMNYMIPSSALRGTVIENSTIHPITCILPQPKMGNKRVLLIFSDGLVVLWDVETNVVVHSSGATHTRTQSEEKKVSSACWVCPIGCKVAIGYTTGELLIFTIPSSAYPIKLNIGFRTDKIPISSLKWRHVDGKSSRLYVSGALENSSANMVQVVLLNDQPETRVIKVSLHLPEPCVSMEIIESPFKLNGRKQELLILVGKSGRVYAYDDHAVERCLHQSQARNFPSTPKQVQLNILQSESSSVTASLLLSNNSTLLNFGEQDYLLLTKGLPPLFSLDGKSKDGGIAHFPGFKNIRKLYITGHGNGSIRFWDVSCAIPLQAFTLTHQNEGNSSPSGVPVTSLLFDVENLEFVSGDNSGIVRVYKLKYSSFPSFPGSSKSGTTVDVQGIKLIKIAGSVLCLSFLECSRHLAIGSEHGNVLLYDLKGSCVFYQTQIMTQISSGIVSLRYHTCNINGIAKNCLLVATRDASVVALDGDNGSRVSPNAVQPKKPSKTLFMDIIDGKFVVVCSEKAAYVYSLDHCLQGVRKVYCKKKFQSSSCSFASICFSESSAVLALLLSSGKLELRSLPDLSLIKNTLIRGCGYPQQKTVTCCSRDGFIIKVNEDQEAIFMSIFLHSEQFIVLDASREVYRKDKTVLEEEHLKKKKNLLSSLVGKSKERKNEEADKAPFEKHSPVFSTAKFPQDEIELLLDDIDLEDDADKRKQLSPKAPRSKGKFAKKFSYWKGKVKEIKGKMSANVTSPASERQETVKVGPADEIKKKYGYSQFDGTLAPAKSAQTQLQENSVKLQRMNKKSAMMTAYARSFSSMANDLLRTVEKNVRF